ncbi:MAG TPA: hypothetical protein VN362_08050, partial [Xanthobacteraceae bacterium]|nr:hypothetical protein [Xanthobacteraceae bacterium]
MGNIEQLIRIECPDSNSVNVCRPEWLRALSCPAKAGHPVNTDAVVKFPVAANTGSSAFADDDSQGYCS